MTLAELAEQLGANLHGDGSVVITGVRGIEEAGPSEITFVANPKYASLARTTRAAAILVEPDFPDISTSTLRLKNPYFAFSRALGFFYQPPSYSPGVHPRRSSILRQPLGWRPTLARMSLLART